MRNMAKRLGALGATALVALVVIGPVSASAQVVTSTTATPTTLPPQKSVHGSSYSQNQCASHLNPSIAADGTPKIGVSVQTDAFGQPHEGKPITLSNTKATVSIPADLLQLGVNAGIIFDQQQIPSTIDFVLGGDGTTQQTHKYTVHATVTVHVTGGVAQPLSSTFSLPNTTWTPVNQQASVFFREKSMLITSVIDLSSTIGQVIIATFSCSGAGAPQILALGGLAAPVTTTTVAAPTTTAAPTTAAPAVTAAAPAATNVLPRTGSNAGLLLAVAVGLLSAGLFALKATGRRSAKSRG